MSNDIAHQVSGVKPINVSIVNKKSKEAVLDEEEQHGAAGRAPSSATIALEDTTERWWWNSLCLGTAVFVILGTLQYFILRECPMLIARLLAHTSLVIVGTLVVLRMVGAYKLHQTLQSHRNTPTQSVRVTKVKAYPETPVRGMKQRIVCRVSFDAATGEDSSFPDASTSTVGAPPPATTALMEFDEEPKDDDDDNTEEAPAVVVDPIDNITVGDRLDVVLMDNNPNKLIYIPYQTEYVKTLCWGVVKGIAWIVVAIMWLLFTMPNVPIAFASSEQVETQILQLCLAFRGTNDDGDEAADDTTPCCRMTWTVTWSYNLILGGVAAIMIAATVYGAMIGRRIVAATSRRVGEGSSNSTVEYHKLTTRPSNGIV